MDTDKRNKKILFISFICDYSLRFTEQSFEALADNLHAQVHDPSGGIDKRWTDSCTFKGTMATPETILTIHDLKQFGVTFQTIGLGSG